MAVDPTTCAIVSLDRATNTAQLCTRVIPYGAGNHLARTTLQYTTRPYRGTFTDPSGLVHTFVYVSGFNYIIDQTAEAQYGRIESVQTFSYIAPAIALSPPSLILASNALYDAALVYLIHHSQPIVTFSLVVAGLQVVLYPGQTIQIIWSEFTDVATVLDINQTLIILEVTNQVTSQGYVTTGLIVSQYPRWPLSDTEVLAQLEQKLRIIAHYPQPLALGAVRAPW